MYIEIASLETWLIVPSLFGVCNRGKALDSTPFFHTLCINQKLSDFRKL
jgi:hypothetical protein